MDRVNFINFHVGYNNLHICIHTYYMFVCVCGYYVQTLYFLILKDLCVPFKRIILGYNAAYGTRSILFMYSNNNVVWLLTRAENRVTIFWELKVTKKIISYYIFICRFSTFFYFELAINLWKIAALKVIKNVSNRLTVYITHCKE